MARSAYSRNLNTSQSGEHIYRGFGKPIVQFEISKKKVLVKKSSSCKLKRHGKCTGTVQDRVMRLKYSCECACHSRIEVEMDPTL